MSFRSRVRLAVVASTANSTRAPAIQDGKQQKSSEYKVQPRLVIVLGKGGSGRTTASVMLAQHYAAQGLRVCLAVQSVDRYAEELLQLTSENPLTATPRVMPVPSVQGEGCLTAMRIEATKGLIEPVEMVKQMDARVGLTQGMMAEVVPEELAILPGMDSLVAAAGLLQAITAVAASVASSPSPSPSATATATATATRVKPGLPPSSSSSLPVDVVVLDALSSGEILRLLGAPQSMRWYLRRFLSLAEKTDVGRLSLPSVARLLSSLLDSLRPLLSSASLPAWRSPLTSSSSPPGIDASGRGTAETWQALEALLASLSTVVCDPTRVTPFLIADASSPSSLSTSLRLFGAAVQAGISPAALLLHAAPPSFSFDSLVPHWQPDASSSSSSHSYSYSLPVVPLPSIPTCPTPSQALAHLEPLAAASIAPLLLPLPATATATPLRLPPAVQMDVQSGTVRFFLPGLHKSEVKLQQWRGASELLLEAAEQRRCVVLPPALRNRRVRAAKFTAPFLTVTLQ